MEQVTQSQQIAMSQKSINNFYKYTYSNSPKNGVQLLCCNMHKRANQNMFCTIFKNHSHLLTFVISRQYIVKCKVTDLNTKRTQTPTLHPLYLYRMGDLIRGDYWHSKVQTHTLQPFYLYRTGDLIRGDYWHSKVQTNAKLNCRSNN